ncbi:hypothetical protein BU23DRAFT_568850 [Bimuria novae-zelandiae CBS 107.79]|uniref:Uncharacterized protein n=1 Tax=Bimuria novae-zelandiae CBS 107.79 TaxID=1447943 RepID=A0A6A5V9D6_9PLEO|nr:hypothetical protein BU23DRAFT_568850 [Bimuria novae-zelandiae CBS 107.79]
MCTVERKVKIGSPSFALPLPVLEAPGPVEEDAAWDFVEHAKTCSICMDPGASLQNHGRLCSTHDTLAQHVKHYFRYNSRGKVISGSDGHQLRLGQEFNNIQVLLGDIKENNYSVEHFHQSVPSGHFVNPAQTEHLYGFRSPTSSPSPSSAREKQLHQRQKCQPIQRYTSSRGSDQDDEESLFPDADHAEDSQSDVKESWASDMETLIDKTIRRIKKMLLQGLVNYLGNEVEDASVGLAPTKGRENRHPHLHPSILRSHNESKQGVVVGILVMILWTMTGRIVITLAQQEKIENQDPSDYRIVVSSTHSTNASPKSTHELHAEEKASPTWQN